MKILFLLLLSIFTFNAFSLETDELIAKLAEFRGGDGSFCNLGEFDPDEFNYRFELKRYRQMVENSYEDGVVYTDWNDIVSMTVDFAGNEWSELLIELWHSDLVLAMFGAQLDPEICTNPQICRHGDVRIFFKNDKHLECYFDF